MKKQIKKMSDTALAEMDEKDAFHAVRFNQASATQIVAAVPTHGEALYEHAAEATKSWPVLNHTWTALTKEIGEPLRQLTIDIIADVRIGRDYVQDDFVAMLVNVNATDAVQSLLLSDAKIAGTKEIFYKFLKRSKDVPIEIWLGGLGDSQKGVRELCEFQLIRVAKVEDILPLMTKKKKNVRFHATKVLAALRDDACVPALQKAFQNEKIDAVRAEIERALTTFGKDVARSEESVLSNVRAGKLPPFIDLSDIPAPSWKAGGVLTEAEMKKLFTLLKREKGKFDDTTLSSVVALLDPETTPDFSQAVWTAWRENGAKPTYKWGVFQLGYFADDFTTDAFARHIGKIESANHKQTAWYVQALGNLTTTRAKSWLLHWYLYPPFSTVFREARKALTGDEQLGHIPYRFIESIPKFVGAEDADRHTLTFADELSQVIDFGDRTFSLRLDQAQKLEVVDNESGKITDALPKPRKGESDDARPAIVALKKSLNGEVHRITKRFEDGLRSNRTWTKSEYLELYGNHPILTPFVGRIIFVDSDENAFRFADGEFVDADYSNVDVVAPIRIVHPVELSTDQLLAWNEQFADLGLTQPISQLSRRIFRKERDPFPIQTAKTRRDRLQERMVAHGWRDGWEGSTFAPWTWFIGRRLKLRVAAGPERHFGAMQSTVKFLELLRGDVEIDVNDLSDVEFSEVAHAILQLAGE